MPNRANRVKKKKFVRTITGVKKRYFKDRNKGKHKCGLCHSILYSTVRNVRRKLNKSAKSARRPSVIFGGVLCSKCRVNIIEEAIKVKTAIKNIEDTNIKERPYIQIMLNKMK